MFRIELSQDTYSVIEFGYDPLLQCFWVNTPDEDILSQNLGPCSIHDLERKTITDIRNELAKYGTKIQKADLRSLFQKAKMHGYFLGENKLNFNDFL